MSKMQDIGAIWKGKTAKGVEKLGIKVELDGKKYNLFALVNTFKSANNQPDYRIFVQEQQEQTEASQSQPDVQPTQTNNPPMTFGGGDDLPF